MCPGQTFCRRLGIRGKKMAWYNLGPRRGVWYVLPRKMRNSPSVPKLRARDPEGVEAGAGGGGGDYSRVVFVCPHPHILPTQLQLPPHPAQPGAGSSCGGTRTRDRSGTFRCPSALVPRSGPRHRGSQRRVLLCHTDLDKFLADSATLYPNSGLKWSCRTPDSTPALVYHGYRYSNEVFSRVCTTLTHT